MMRYPLTLDRMNTLMQTAEAAPAKHATHSAATLGITPRDIAFDVNADRIADWAGRDFMRTSFFNALSLMFPIGERFFIQSVSVFRDKVSDPKLLAEVKAFVAQEGMHTREHISYNEAMKRFVDVAHVETREAGMIAFLREHTPPLYHLSVTCALEHFTAIMAHELLKRDVYLAGSEETYGRLWTWHAVEECEHKSVAFDVLQAATNGKNTWLRRRTMATVTINFLRDIFVNCYDVFRGKNMQTSPLLWARLGWYLLGYPGFLRNLLPAYVQYYRGDFHPSQIDDEAELKRGLAAISVDRHGAVA